MTRIVMVSGSPSEPSKLAALLEWLGKRFETHGIETYTIHVRNLPADDLLHARSETPAIVRANQAIMDSDAIVVGTPIYKAAYTGVLKAYLDLLPIGALEGKPVLPVAVGGTIAHLLALEYALKPVLAILGACTLEKSVYGLDTQFTDSEAIEGYQLAADLQKRLFDAAAQLVQRIEPIALRSLVR